MREQNFPPDQDLIFLDWQTQFYCRTGRKPTRNSCSNVSSIFLRQQAIVDAPKEELERQAMADAMQVLRSI